MEILEIYWANANQYFHPSHLMLDDILHNIHPAGVHQISVVAVDGDGERGEGGQLLVTLDAHGAEYVGVGDVGGRAVDGEVGVVRGHRGGGGAALGGQRGGGGGWTIFDHVQALEMARHLHVSVREKPCKIQYAPTVK